MNIGKAKAITFATILIILIIIAIMFFLYGQGMSRSLFRF